MTKRRTGDEGKEAEKEGVRNEWEEGRKKKEGGGGAEG